MLLKDLLQESSKAQLQAYYVYWFPGKEIAGTREKLAADLYEAMTDHGRVRQRFDALPRSHKAFVLTLLMKAGCSATVNEVRAHRQGRVIEGFEVEGLLKSLQEQCYIVKASGTGGYASEVFAVPEELAVALRRTIAVEERDPLEMLSLRRHGGAQESPTEEAEDLSARIQGLADAELVRLVKVALSEHMGVLTHSAAVQAGLFSGAATSANGGSQEARGLSRPEWRRELEEKGLGTTGILSLKDFGIDLEEEGLFVYQENVHAASLAAAQAGAGHHDEEISLGVDLIIDLDRALEVLRSEVLEVTREGNIYRKIEERIAEQFVTSHYKEFQDGLPVGHVLDLCRRLQFFEEEGQRLTVDPLRRRVWRKKPLLRKVEQIHEIYRNENRGHRWSFHQPLIREIFIDQLLKIQPGSWLVARPFLTAAISKYLQRLDEEQVSKTFQERCTGDFQNETLVVPLSKLYHDLLYWVTHRLVLLGLVDAGYKDGSFHSLRLSRLGLTHFGLSAPETAPPAAQNGAEKRKVSANAQVLINPDFEILVYPEAPEEASWMVSLFADRVNSDRVKRYRLSRESLKRGIVAGLHGDEILQFLEGNSRGPVPPNVAFSIREWTDGVEVVRRQKVTVLTAHSASGCERLRQILEARDVPHERLNDTTIMVRGVKNERLLKELEGEFEDLGLYVE